MMAKGPNTRTGRLSRDRWYMQNSPSEDDFVMLAAESGGTAAYQGQYMAWIATAKRDETRARRTQEAVELLGLGRKLGMR